jgi:hypothetical protein
MVEDIDVFQRVEAFAAFELINFIIGINIQFVFTQNSYGRGTCKGETQFIFLALVNDDSITV